VIYYLYECIALNLIRRIPLTETVADLSDAPFTGGGVIVNRVVLVTVLTFFLTVSTIASAYAVGTLYFPGDRIAERVTKTSHFSKKLTYRATGLGLSALATLAFFLVMENRNIENYRKQLFNRLNNLRAIIYKSYDICSSKVDTYNETMYYSWKYLQNLSNSLNLWEIRLINYEMQLSFADSIKKLSTIDKVLENIKWQFWEDDKYRTGIITTTVAPI